jgi:hypothetical protein
MPVLSPLSLTSGCTYAQNKRKSVAIMIINVMLVTDEHLSCVSVLEK